jgi:branched-chain amino acid transport system substrate-binding protein
MNQKLHVALIVGMAAVAAALGWVTARPEPSVIRIGVGQPLSGPVANLGQDMLHGAQLAADDINAAGGVRVGDKSLRIEIVTADDQSDAEAGKLAAKKLVDAGVVAAIAHLNSGVSIAAAPIYAAAGIPQLAISTKPQYTQLGLPTTLRMVANDDIQGGAMSSFAMGLPGASRFAVVDDGSPFGTGLADNVAKTLAGQGRSVVVRRSLDDKTTALGALVQELATAQADVLVTTLGDFQIAALLPELAAKGLTQLRILGADNSKTDRVVDAQLTQGGVYATSGIIDAKEFPTSKAFLANFHRRFGGDPIYGAHYAYDAIHLIADAVTRNRSLDRAQLLKRLKEFDGNAPVTGSMRFREDGEQRYASVAVYRCVKNRWELQMRSAQW